MNWLQNLIPPQLRNNQPIKPEYLSYMMPMGGLKTVSPLIKGSNFLREADMPGVNSWVNEMKNYKIWQGRQAAANYAQQLKEEAFNRAHQGFDSTKLISNFIKRNLK
jgi:hypothetical protein